MKQKIKKYVFIGFLLGVVFLNSSIKQAKAAAEKATASLSISPAVGSFELGKTFSVTINVSSKSQAMNAASGVISFPKDKLEVVSLNKNKSVMSLWVQEPSFSNTEGKLSFEGIVLNPGFQGASGKILTVKFKAKGSGDATVKFSSGTVLANDGQGTNILSKLGSAKFKILPRTAVVPSVLAESPKSTLKNAELRASAKSASTGKPLNIPVILETFIPQILNDSDSRTGIILFAIIFPSMIVVVFSLSRCFSTIKPHGERSRRHNRRTDDEH